jgi:predicted nucleotidyltransferase
MMPLEQILSTLHSKQSYFAQKYRVKNFAVFGSYARGEATDCSDIDIMVEFTKAPGIEFIDLAVELEKLLNHKVDLVSRNGIKDSYFGFITDDLKYA